MTPWWAPTLLTGASILRDGPVGPNLSSQPSRFRYPLFDERRPKTFPVDILVIPSSLVNS